MKKIAFFLLALISVVPLHAANIYWVSFHPADNTPSAGAATAGFTNAPDIGYTQLLRAQGHTVTRVVSSDTPDTNLLNTADLVIISRSVPSGNYELDPETAAWNGITAPMIVMGGYVLRNTRLGFTTGTTIPDAVGSVSLTASVPSHPIFSGITLNASNTMVNPYANIVSFTNNPQRGISVNTDPVAGGGTVLATISSAGNPAGGLIIGEWQAGATLGNSPPDKLGGHRLVFLSGSREATGLTSEGSGIFDLTGDGSQLFLNAVKYMAGEKSWRLVGITGAQTDGTLNGTGGFVYPDHTLFDISLTNGAVSKLFAVTWINDSQALGYNPTNGLLYHTGGSAAYSNNPLRNGHDQGGPDIAGVGYQDSQYMETVNLATRAMAGVFNADPCPNPDSTLPCFGLVAPVPSWVLPAYRRDSTQTDGTNRVDGVNEYHAARGLAWSTNKNLFYLSDENGIFTMTPDGVSTFLARPAFAVDSKNTEAKGIAFVTTTKLLVGHRNGSGTNGYLMELNPQTGAAIGELPLTYPPGGGDPVDAFGGLLGLAQHPVTGVLYGIRQTADPFARELVTINPVTGATALVGNMGMHIASVTFAPAPTAVSVPIRIQSVVRNGNNLTLAWSGGNGPYQVQRRTTLSGGTWANEGTPTIGNSAVVPITGSEGYFRVLGN